MTSNVITILETPGSDEALGLVRAGLDAAPGKYKEAEFLPRLAGAFEALASGVTSPIDHLDVVGHGAPAVLSVGATAAGADTYQSQYTKLDVAEQKAVALNQLRKRLLEAKKANKLSPDFTVRLIGCRVAQGDTVKIDDDGQFPQRDGTVLLHMLASFLDFPVEGTIDYVGADHFASGAFDPNLPGSIIRMRRCDALPGDELRFTPTLVTAPSTTVPPSGSMAPTLSAASFSTSEAFEDSFFDGAEIDGDGVVDQGSTADWVPELLVSFHKEGKRLTVKKPLVSVDVRIRTPRGELLVVEEGRAALLRWNGELARFSTRPNHRVKVASWLGRLTKKPSWTDPKLRLQSHAIVAGYALPQGLVPPPVSGRGPTRP